jgi:hypothetical protein
VHDEPNPKIGHSRAPYTSSPINLISPSALLFSTTPAEARSSDSLHGAADLVVSNRHHLVQVLAAQEIRRHCLARTPAQ